MVYAAGIHCLRTTTSVRVPRRIIVHGAGRDLRRGDGVDEQARAVRDIAAGEYIGRGGLVGLAIHLDEAALRFRRRRPDSRKERSEVWPMAKMMLSAGMSSTLAFVERWD